MKKFKSLLVLLICVVMLSGCVKSHTTMTIKADKSMDYEGEVLFAESVAGEMGEMIKPEEYEKKGFTVTNISENGYTGIKIKKSFKNIDDMANNKGEEVVISNFMNDDFNQKVVFKLEKGFFKNTYIAKFKYEQDTSTDSLNNTEDTVDTVGEGEDAAETVEATEPLLGADDATVDTTTETTDNTGTTTTTEETTTTTDDTTTGTDTSEGDLSGLEDLMGLAGEMEFTYKVVLPVKAGNNNATKVSEDGKTLTWNLATDKASQIEFTFSLLNLTNVLIVVGVALLVVIGIVVALVVMKKKKASADVLIHTDYDPSIAGNVPQDPNAPVAPPMDPVAPMPEAPATMPQTDNLQFNLPNEETQNQINVVPQGPQFITNEVESAVDSVAESAPVVAPEVAVVEPPMEPVVDMTPVTPVVDVPPIPDVAPVSEVPPMPDMAPAVEPAMEPVAPMPEMAPVAPTPVAPMPEVPPTVSVPETPTVVIPEVPPVDTTNNPM